MLELSKELNSRGYQVTVITTWPEYNLNGNKGIREFTEIEEEQGISVIRIKTLPHHNINYFLRGIAQLLMPLQFLLKLWMYKVKVDACIIYSPPLTLAFVGIVLKIQGVKSLLNIQDLFPQNAIDLGVLSNPIQIWFFRCIEIISYRFSDCITVHSEGNRQSILKKYPDLTNKLKTLHNWVDLDHHQTGELGIDFRKKWNLKHPLIAVFAGVMGPSQYLNLILNIANRIQDNSEILFLLVGGGAEKEDLIESAAEKKLTNVRFENFVSREDYPSLLKVCSLGLVCLSPMNRTPVVPGKILGYMAAGLPVVAFLHEESDGHAIIQEAECGITANSSDEEACVQAFLKILACKHRFLEMGRSGRSYAEKNFSKKICVSQMEQLFLK